MRIFVSVAIAALGLALMPLTAANAEDCGDVQGRQAGMNDCYGKQFKKSDAELNKLYKQIQGRLKGDAGTMKLLVTAQKTWVAFRDAECNFQSSGSEGGSARPMIVLMCLDGLTRSRIGDFKGYLKCEEGDMSCPVPAAN
jgi:uncharacterized protein YecT (DUF1311 family)